MVDKMNDMFRIGVITEPHGVRGEVKVYPTTDDADRIKKLKEIILDNGKEMQVLHPEGMKWNKQFIIIKFKEFENRDAVERLRKKELYVTRENAVPLKKDEYYISDLEGLKVLDEEEKEIGTLTKVITTGANDVYEIELLNGGEVLLPAIKQCILAVNVSEGYMKVHIMEGLM